MLDGFSSFPYSMPHNLPFILLECFLYHFRETFAATYFACLVSCCRVEYITSILYCLLPFLLKCCFLDCPTALCVLLLIATTLVYLFPWCYSSVLFIFPISLKSLLHYYIAFYLFTTLFAILSYSLIFLLYCYTFVLFKSFCVSFFIGCL
jgi:hypothetical protein